MATVLRLPKTVEPHRNGRKPSRPHYPGLTPSLLHAVLVAAKKRAADCRDKLRPGEYKFDECVQIVGTLRVAHDIETAATVTPDAVELLALVLSKLNAATRNIILRELPAEFAANGCMMPVVEPSLVEAAGTLCSRLRRKVTQSRRGAVTGNLAVYAVNNFNVPRGTNNGRRFHALG